MPTSLLAIVAVYHLATHLCIHISLADNNTLRDGELAEAMPDRAARAWLVVTVRLTSMLQKCMAEVAAR